MGNITYTQKNYKKSVEYLRQATANHPSSAAAWNNLAVAEKAAGLTVASENSAQRAKELGY